MGYNVFISLCAAALLSAVPASGGPLAPIQLRIVTADNPPVGGGHLAPAGALIDLPAMPAPLNPDGVVSLVDVNAGIFSSGALIADRFVLTAAHSVDSTSNFSFNAVRFETSAGVTSTPVHNVVIHPMYDRTVEGGFDIAVIELAEDAPALAPRYGLYTGTDELGQVSVKLGYGRTGHGGTGATNADGLRRAGLNTYDGTSTTYNNAFGQSMAVGAYLMYDFDSGLPGNDAWGQHGGPIDLGFGEHEVNTTSGDSGGPTLIHDGSDWRIAGVTAWGVGLDADPPDVTPGITDASFGEISADSRVSSYAGFVQSVVEGTFTVPVVSGFSHGNHRAALSWDRPNEQGTAIVGGGAVTYHATAFTVDQAGDYDITAQQNFDGVIHLYQGTLDPGNPLAGLIAGNDDANGGAGTSALPGVTLSAGATYTLVTSGADASEVGTFLNTIDGPGQATAAASVGGFVGGLAPIHWQFQTNHVDTRAQTDTAPASITLYGGNDLTGGNTDYTSAPADAATTVRFSWTYFAEDDLGFDLLSLLVDGASQIISTGATLFGDEEITLQPGETFGFRIFSPDGANGRGVVTIDQLRVVGDLDGDGTVGAQDLDLVLRRWSPTVSNPGDIADATGDGRVGPEDLQFVMDRWNAGFTADGSQATVVPEPRMTVLGLIALFGRARRRR